MLPYIVTIHTYYFTKIQINNDPPSATGSSQYLPYVKFRYQHSVQHTVYFRNSSHKSSKCIISPLFYYTVPNGLYHFLPTQEVQMKTAPRRTASLTALHFLKY